LDNGSHKSGVNYQITNYTITQLTGRQATRRKFFPSVAGNGGAEETEDT
jgi:hypothetical protein